MTNKPFLTELLFDMTEESLFHQAELRNERVHELWWLLSGALQTLGAFLLR